MYITLTTSKPDTEQARKLEAFLADFLPRMEREAGIVAIYHYTRPEQGEDVTVVIWESQEAAMNYRAGALIQEVNRMEKELNLPVTREGYPLLYASSGSLKRRE
jgi:quinol monooxygenase YgiN